MEVLEITSNGCTYISIYIGIYKMIPKSILSQGFVVVAFVVAGIAVVVVAVGPAVGGVQQ